MLHQRIQALAQVVLLRPHHFTAVRRRHSGEYSEGRRVSGVLLGGDTQPRKVSGTSDASRRG